MKIGFATSHWEYAGGVDMIKTKINDYDYDNRRILRISSEYAQCTKEYFKTRSRDLLSKSMQLEKQVDDEIKRAKEGASQTALF